MSIKKVCVLGGGLMGRQIALCSAIHGYSVVCKCYNDAEVENVQKWEEEYLAGRIAKGRMTEEAVAATKERFSLTASYEEALSDCDLVIEAVLEQVDLKKSVFDIVEKLAPPTAIVATNSSMMVSSTFKDCFADPSRLANMHYYNPALVMDFVEVMKGEHTSQETADALVEFAKSCGKVPALMFKENEGNIGSYIANAITSAAWVLVEGGYCNWKDIDNACEMGLRHPMGPFRLMDFTGVDLTFDIEQKKFEKTGEKSGRYEMLKEMVEQGRCGRKTGKGFYDYD